jgi:hypothetical protein
MFCSFVLLLTMANHHTRWAYACRLRVCGAMWSLKIGSRLVLYQPDSSQRSTVFVPSFAMLYSGSL